MAKLDNPAGRLYEILGAYKQHAQTGVAVVDTWVTVFGVDDRDTALLRVAETAGLIPQIEAALTRVGDPGQLGMFHAFAGSLIHAVIHPRVDMHGAQSTSAVIEDQPFAVLGGISGFLSATASEGPVPDADQLGDLRAQARELIDAIDAESGLADEVRRAALAHAYRLAEALDHIRIAGPDGVQTALERLFVASLRADPEIRKTSAWTRLMAVGGAIWTAFTLGGPATEQALESWAEVFKLLPGGS